MTEIDILDAATGEVVDACTGPTAGGACPRARPDGVVACAGRRIAPEDADPEYWMLWIPPSSHHCPLSWPIAEACY